MPSALIRAQARRLGIGPAVTLTLAAAVTVLTGWVTSSTWSLTESVTLMTWLSQILTLIAGIVVAASMTGDQLVELHESTPTSYRRVQLLRAAMVIAGAAAVAAITFVPLHVLGIWPRDAGWRSILVPVGAVIFLGAVALVTAAYSGSVGASTIAVVAAWMFLAMLWDPYVLPLYLQRGLPLVVSAALFVTTWVRLGHPEQNIAMAVAT